MLQLLSAVLSSCRGYGDYVCWVLGAGSDSDVSEEVRTRTVPYCTMLYVQFIISMATFLRNILGQENEITKNNLFQGTVGGGCA